MELLGIACSKLCSGGPHDKHDRINAQHYFERRALAGTQRLDFAGFIGAVHKRGQITDSANISGICDLTPIVRRVSKSPACVPEISLRIVWPCVGVGNSTSLL